jgi:hypothetical protein
LITPSLISGGVGMSLESLPQLVRIPKNQFLVLSSAWAGR